jgi:hypothetical protein
LFIQSDLGHRLEGGLFKSVGEAGEREKEGFAGRAEENNGENAARDAVGGALGPGSVSIPENHQIKCSN